MVTVIDNFKLPLQPCSKHKSIKPCGFIVQESLMIYSFVLFDGFRPAITVRSLEMRYTASWLDRQLIIKALKGIIEYNRIKKSRSDLCPKVIWDPS